MKLKFSLSSIIPASPKQIYNAWLDSEQHNEMTNGESAVQSQKVGAIQKAHGDYIWGKNVELVPYSKIVQTWRSTGFREEDKDSILEVLLEENPTGTKVSLKHSNLPETESGVEQGWEDYYFTPMKDYFQSINIK